MSRPTFRQHLAHFPGWIWANGNECRCSKAIPLYPFIARYGLDAPMSVMERVMRCTEGHRPPMGFTVPSPTGSHGFGEIPVERVPANLRSYARIDPAHLPAPLRAPALHRGVDLVVRSQPRCDG